MWKEYELPTSYKGIEFNTDWRVILDIQKIFLADDLTRREKEYLICRKFFKDKIPENAWDIIFNFISGAGKHKKSSNTAQKEPLFDWEQDFDLIIAPVNKIAGKDIRALEYLHWWTFLSYFQEIGECTFATFVNIRKKKQKGEKLEDYEKKIYKENRERINIKKVDAEMQAVIDDIMGRR